MWRRTRDTVSAFVVIATATAVTIAGVATASVPVGAETATPLASAAAPRPTGNGAIFFHPDGTSASHWDAMRIVSLGPDAESNWDRLPEIAPYRGQLVDRITATSNGGAVTHATGTRAHAATFGLDPDGQEYVSANGTTNTIVEEAILAGLGTALLQTGSAVEPGTAAFVAEAPTRADYEDIVLQLVESGVDIVLGGGEEWFLPEGLPGRHCSSGSRSDGQNLVTLAKERGYTIVYTRDELLALPAAVSQVVGIFACGHTFNGRSEEDLTAAGLPVYVETAPTMTEMIEFALPRVSANPSGFLIVAEEEGTDDLCNAGNASGCLEALERADDALGVMAKFVDANPNTLLVTTSDSAAGGMSVVTFAEDENELGLTPPKSENRGPCDGIAGTASPPFISAPDEHGTAFPFMICWSTYDDVGSGVIARAQGLEAATLLPETGIANTDIYRMLYYTLFGEHIP